MNDFKMSVGEEEIARLYVLMERARLEYRKAKAEWKEYTINYWKRG